MNKKLFLVVLSVALLIGCVTKKQDTPAVATEQEYVDPDLIGQWKCTVTGYESTITIRKKGDSYTALIDFERENMESKSEVLSVEGEKYRVSRSSAGEFYLITNGGNLELWDTEGLWTTAVNITPGQESSLPKFSAKKAIGENVFSIANTYSKSTPETLSGTNNQYWIVYYKDLDVTFKVLKKTDVIQSGKSGKHRNL